MGHINYLPELEIKSSFSKFYGFYNRAISISKYSTDNFPFTYIGKTRYTSTIKPMNFNPEVESEAIREAGCQNFMKILVQPLNEWRRDSTQTKTTAPQFQICYSLSYINKGNN